MVSLNTEMELNKIYHMDNREGLKQLPEKCANLIISDPPYFEVKGEFDFVWKDFDEYLRFMEEQAVLYKRILADNGTLFVWGYSKHIAYIQVIFDKYFNLENSLVWRKVDSMQYQYYSVELARRFNTHNERLLMYSIEDTDAAMEKFRYRNPFSIYLKSEFKKLGITNRDVSKLFPSKTGGLTGCVSNWLNGENVITKEQYDVIRMNYNSQILRKDYWLLRGEYDRLYQEFEAYRRPFNNEAKLEEVLEFSQESHISKDYEHETKKPETLARALILTCSRKNDIVVVPFAGSGTECAMAAKEGRRFIGFDVNPDYVEMSNKRANEQKQQQQLF